MVVLYVLDQTYQVIGSIDQYDSLIWRPSYNEVGDFELYVKATPDLIQLLKKDYYLVRSQDCEYDSAWNRSIYNNVMIIKNFKLTTDLDNGDFYTVTGKELKYLLHQRIVWTQTNLTGRLNSAMDKLVRSNAIEPTDTKRIIPNLNISTGYLSDYTISKQVTGAYLDEAVIDICNTYNLGWYVRVIGGIANIIFYSGIDRSYDQTDRPYVVFSEEFDNILNSEYQLNSDEYANTTLIGGEGEGIERIYVTVGGNNSGLNRYETFTDARDISQNKGTSDEIPLTTYKTLLEVRGTENLASKQYTEGFSGEVNDTSFKYHEDYYLGDIVTVINRYGISKNVRVVSAIESDDETGAKLIPQFNF